MRRLWKIEQIAGKDEEGDEEEGEEKEGESSDDGEGELSKEEEEVLEERVLGFLILLMDHNLKDDKFKSAFVSAVAAFSIDINRG